MINGAGTLALVDRASSDAVFREKLLAECRVAVAASEPAASAEIGVLLHRLTLHYPDRKLNDKEAVLVAQDWLSDLEGIPLDILELAFKRWRTGPKCAFYPKPGEILALVESEQRIRRHLAKRGRDVLDHFTTQTKSA